MEKNWAYLPERAVHQFGSSKQFADNRGNTFMIAVSLDYQTVFEKTVAHYIENEEVI